MAACNNISYLKRIGFKTCWFKDRFQLFFKGLLANSVSNINQAKMD